MWDNFCPWCRGTGQRQQVPGIVCPRCHGTGHTAPDVERPPTKEEYDREAWALGAMFGVLLLVLAGVVWLVIPVL